MKRAMLLSITFAIVLLLSAPSSMLIAEQKEQPKQTDLKLSDPMPVDPDVTIGQFDNGLRYYVRANKNPEDRAYLRLVVNVGSVLEDEGQQGLANLVEHMALKGTKHLPEKELVAFAESAGIELGKNIRASVDFDETVYRMRAPTDDPKVVEKAFEILENWAHLASFEQEAIEKERKAAFEDRRMRCVGKTCMPYDKLEALSEGSRYAERMPFGKKEVVETSQAEELQKFYKDS